MSASREDAIALLSSVFGQAWTTKQLEAVLTQCGGNVDRAIEAMLENEERDPASFVDSCAQQTAHSAATTKSKLPETVGSKVPRCVNEEISGGGPKKELDNQANQLHFIPTKKEDSIGKGKRMPRGLSPESMVSKFDRTTVGEELARNKAAGCKPSAEEFLVEEPSFPDEEEEYGGPELTSAPTVRPRHRLQPTTAPTRSPTPGAFHAYHGADSPFHSEGERNSALARNDLEQAANESVEDVNGSEVAVVPIATVVSGGGRGKRKKIWMCLAGAAAIIIVGLVIALVLRYLKTPATAVQNQSNTNSLEQDCIVSAWSSWSACSATCGGGTQIRIRAVDTQPGPRGKPCPPKSQLEEKQECNTDPCPGGCKVSPWSAWSECSKECGGGTQSRTRTYESQTGTDVEPCDSQFQSEETQNCNVEPCPGGCKLSPWSGWSDCSKMCGIGTQTRTRSIEAQPDPGGEPCPPSSSLEETRDCNTEPCPGGCRVSSWSGWSACSETCGGGTETRSRTVEAQPDPGGEPCPPQSQLEETRECNTQCCPVHCQISSWTGWSECSEKCGGGTQARTRTIEMEAVCGGSPCPDSLKEVRDCNSQCCPVDCEVSDWSGWSSCSKACGGGTQTRTRYVELEAKCGGEECPSLTKERECNTQCCPVDCEVSDWSDWGPCSKPCGGGTQTRTRTVIRDAACGGKSCPALERDEECNVLDCPCTFASSYRKCYEESSTDCSDHDCLDGVHRCCEKEFCGKCETLGCIGECAFYLSDCGSTPVTSCDSYKQAIRDCCSDDRGHCTDFDEDSELYPIEELCCYAESCWP